MIKVTLEVSYLHMVSENALYSILPIQYIFHIPRVIAGFNVKSVMYCSIAVNNMLFLFPSSCVYSTFTEPEVVSKLIVTMVTTSSVTLNWAQPEGNVTSYIVQWTLGGPAINNTTNGTSFMINDLIPGSQYNITVIAVAGESSNMGEGITITNFTSRSMLLGESTSL